MSSCYKEDIHKPSTTDAAVMKGFRAHRMITERNSILGFLYDATNGNKKKVEYSLTDETFTETNFHEELNYYSYLGNGEFYTSLLSSVENKVTIYNALNSTVYKTVVFPFFVNDCKISHKFIYVIDGSLFNNSLKVFDLKTNALVDSFHLSYNFNSLFPSHDGSRVFLLRNSAISTYYASYAIDQTGNITEITDFKNDIEPIGENDYYMSNDGRQLITQSGVLLDDSLDELNHFTNNVGSPYSKFCYSPLTNTFHCFTTNEDVEYNGSSFSKIQSTKLVQPGANLFFHSLIPFVFNTQLHVIVNYNDGVYKWASIKMKL